MGNSQQIASGDEPACRRGDIVKALHPGLQSFCRARVVDVKKMKIVDGSPPRWVVMVRWCDYWCDEPDAVSVIEPTIATPATIPQNKYLSFIQIVSSPFPYYPQFSEVFFQPSEGDLLGNINTWQPGFVIEENEYQYCIKYANQHWKQHPLLAMEEGADEEDEEKRMMKNQAERARMKVEYKAELIRNELRKEKKKREKIMAERNKVIEQARSELFEVQTRLMELKKQIGEPDNDPTPEEEVQLADLAREIDVANKKLQQALAALKAPIDAADQEDEDQQREDGTEQSVSFSRPSISKPVDNSLIYHIDYAALDPTFIYDPDARMDEGGEGEEEDHGLSPVEALELEMQRQDPNQPQHPSLWLDERGEEKNLLPITPKAPASPLNKAKKSRNLFQESTKDFFADDATAAAGGAEANDSDKEDEDGEDDDDLDSSDDEAKPRPPPLLTASGAVLGARDPMLRSVEDQRSIDEWHVDYPKFVEAWVNKYSTRIKRQTSFFNNLYSKYLEGKYEATIEDKLFEAQRKMEQEIAAEAAKPKKWYHLKKKDTEADFARLYAKAEAKAIKAAEKSGGGSSLFGLRGNENFDDYDTGLEIERRERYERVVEQDNKWFIEENLELDGDHLDETGASTSVVKHKRKIHTRDKDDLWDSFMSEAWVRYRYEYRDHDHPEAAPMSNPRGSLPSTTTAPGGRPAFGRGSTIGGGRRVAPKKFKWIWAQIQGKDANEMVLLLQIPDSLKKHAIQQALLKKKKAARDSITANSSISMGKNASISGASGIGSEDRIILRRENEQANAKLIKFYHDRIRRWSMDSYRRYQLELAQHGLRLIFVYRTVPEANEDLDETEKELNLIIQQNQLQHELNQAKMKHQIATSMAKIAASDPEHHLELDKDNAALAQQAQPSTRMGRFKRGSNAMTRGSIFAQLQPGQLTEFSSTPTSKSFASNYLTGELGYGILGYDDMREDGNSLYRSVSLQLFGTQDNYLFLKQQCIQHIASHSNYYVGFLDISFEYYLSTKFRSLDPESEVIAYGDHLDLQAICEMYDVAVHIYSQVELGAKDLAPGNTPTNHADSHQHHPPLSGMTAADIDSLIRNQPMIRFYDDVMPDGSKLPTILLSYAGYGHYDSIKKSTTPWPLMTSIGFPVYTRTRIRNTVLRARQRTEFESVEKVRVDEARKAYELIATATAHAPIGQPKKDQSKAKRLAAQRRANARMAAAALGQRYIESSSESEEEDITLETVIASMQTKTSRIVKPIDTQKMELNRTILQPRELVLSTYIGEVLFDGDGDRQTSIFLDCLATCKIEYGTKKALLAQGYKVQQPYSERFWHDMQMQSTSELVSQLNLEGLAAVAMYGQEDGAGGATTMTGEGLKLNLPRIIVMYPYYPEDAHLEGEELEEHRKSLKNQKNDTGRPPLMLIEGVQLAVEEFVRVVRGLAKITRLVRTSQATWLPPC